ncbi:MMPL family transporter [Thermoleophilum album]|uniref:Predicted exporter protein, RND superfamily n=1 Tax=Thermoleophilum album TaxID=29539 RepID=A0A1H6FQN3_THEAL|nr:MMPL family transporter [Thermoleophilum album]SEH12163.1 Predicted exporter protein, RND superfamily [Thermoleophilum album]
MERVRALLAAKLPALAGSRRPAIAVAVVALLLAVLAAVRLEPTASLGDLVARGSTTWRETRLQARAFGDDAIVVAVRGDLQRTLLTADLARVLRLEGCLGGRVPEQGLRTLPRVCRELARLRPARIVYGPATFINTAAIRLSDELARRREEALASARRAASTARRRAQLAGQPPAVQEQAAKEAERAELARFTSEILRLALRYGLTGAPSIADPNFVAAIVFEPGRPAGTPKARFSYLFPSSRLALIQMRLRPELTDAQRRRAVALVREAVAAPQFRTRYGARYEVTGVPAIVADLTDTLAGALARLLVVATLVMGLVLLAMQRGRARLLPLASALAAAGATFGVLAALGGKLTLAALAVLPVLVGLAVDYAVQVRARLTEALARRRRADAALRELAARSAPALLAAGFATAAGFVALLASPLPVVRTFGALLILGTLLALAAALLALPALVGGDAAQPPVEGRERRAGHWAPLRRLAVVAGRPLESASARAFDAALLRPGRVLRVGVAVGAAGLVLGLTVPVESDLSRLLPRDLPSVRAALDIQRESGFAGQVDVLVKTRDLTDPALLRWMESTRERILRDAGWRPGRRCGTGHGDAPVCPGPSYSELLGAAGVTSAAQARQLLAQVPPYLLQGVVDQRRGLAVASFGIAALPLERQRQLVDEIRAHLDPPRGVEAHVVGTVALAADAAGTLASPLGRLATLAFALAMAWLVLLAATRSRRQAVVPLVPVALAAGWSGAVTFLLHRLPGPLGIELNPLSATLAVLVVAITTEFAVLLCARYRDERRAGVGVEKALALTYASTGRAVLVSAVTTIAGFLVLATSDIVMLRSFGLLTVIDLALSLAGVVVFLPALLVRLEERQERARQRELDAGEALPVGSLR